MNTETDTAARHLELILLRDKAEMTARRCEQMGQLATLQRVTHIRRRIDRLLAIHARLATTSDTSGIRWAKSN